MSEHVANHFANLIFFGHVDVDPDGGGFSCFEIGGNFFRFLADEVTNGDLRA